MRGLQGLPYLYHDGSQYKLLAGNYTVKEVQAPQGYQVSQEVKAAAVAKDAVAELIWQDKPIDVAIRKTDALGSRLEGAEFLIIPDKGSAFAKLQGEEETPKELIITDDNADNIIARLIAANSYVISEKKEPAGYIRLAEPITISVEKDGTLKVTKDEDQAAALDTSNTVLSITNKETKVYLDKISNEKAEDGSIRRVDGAKLQIQTADGIPVSGKEWTSDGVNAGIITGLAAGQYQLAEVEAPYGYHQAEPVKFELLFNNKVLQDGSDTPLEADQDGICTVTMRDEVIRADAVLKKHAEGDASAVLEGAGFQCYRQKGEAPDIKADELLADNLATDGMGTARMENLTEGSYYFLETKSTESTWLDASNNIWQFDITAENHKQTIDIKAENKLFQAAASVIKKDATDGYTIAGAEFTVSRQTEDGWQTVSQALTDGMGKVTFALNCKGRYRIAETKAAQGYQLDAENPWIQEFSVDDSSYDKEFMWDALNDRLDGSLSLNKTDEADKSPLNDVIFTIYQSQADGSTVELGSFATGHSYLRDISGSFSETEEEDGLLKLQGLAWGNYYIQETKGLEGYVPDYQKYEFVIDQKNLDIKLNAESNGTITNAQTRVWFHKYGKLAEECADSTLGDFPDCSSLVPLQGSEFTVYTDAACTDAIASAASREDGLVEFYKLPVGTQYYIKESKASEGYLLNGNVLAQFTSSGTEPYVVYGDKMDGKLLAGHQYKLVEEEAPQGYLKAGPVTFTVEGKLTGPGENYVQMVEMIDERIEETVKPSDPEPEPEPVPQRGEDVKKIEAVKKAPQIKSAETGDEMQAGGYILAMLFALMLAIAALRKK